MLGTEIMTKQAVDWDNFLSKFDLGNAAIGAGVGALGTYLAGGDARQSLLGGLAGGAGGGFFGQDVYDWVSNKLGVKPTEGKNYAIEKEKRKMQEVAANSGSQSRLFRKTQDAYNDRRKSESEGRSGNLNIGNNANLEPRNNFFWGGARQALVENPLIEGLYKFRNIALHNDPAFQAKLKGLPQDVSSALQSNKGMVNNNVLGLVQDKAFAEDFSRKYQAMQQNLPQGKTMNDYNTLYEKLKGNKQDFIFDPEQYSNLFYQ